MLNSDGFSSSIAVVGASGFVGSAVVRELTAAGHEVKKVSAPRISDGSEMALEKSASELALKLSGSSSIVNCAGLANATSADESALFAANTWSAAAVARAAGLCEAERLVHVSSAAVQGRRRVLDTDPAEGALTPYGHSKAAGERLVREAFQDAVLYRPPGVHAADRAVTRAVVRVASSPLASVAGRGDFPTAQALLPNVASAIAFLATVAECPPDVVNHPSENLTTAKLLRLLGGREPRKIPISLAGFLVAAGVVSGRRVPFVGAQARRLESLWFGQEQAHSWLEAQGWRPPVGEIGWLELGDVVRRG